MGGHVWGVGGRLLACLPCELWPQSMAQRLSPSPDSRYLTLLVCVGFVALTPVWVLVAKQNPPVVKILKFGWLPIVLAMVLSRCTWWCHEGLGEAPVTVGTFADPTPHSPLPP